MRLQGLAGLEAAAVLRRNRDQFALAVAGVDEGLQPEVLDHLDHEIELRRATGVEVAGAQADRQTCPIGGDRSVARERDLPIAVLRQADDGATLVGRRRGFDVRPVTYLANKRS